MARAPFQQLPFGEVPDAPRIPHRWAEATRSDVTIDTPELGPTRIAVRSFGQGPPLLLVHGLMTAGYSFRYLLDLLGTRYRLVIPISPAPAGATTRTAISGPMSSRARSSRPSTRSGCAAAR